MLTIAVGKKQETYRLREITNELDESRGFELVKQSDGMVYHLRVGIPEQSRCECIGFLHHHRCKHLEGLAALIAAQRI